MINDENKPCCRLGCWSQCIPTTFLTGDRQILHLWFLSLPMTHSNLLLIWISKQISAKVIRLWSWKHFFHWSSLIFMTKTLEHAFGTSSWNWIIHVRTACWVVENKCFESIICCNDELSSTMSWVGCLLKDSVSEFQSFLSYLQKIAKSFSKFLSFPFS